MVGRENRQAGASFSASHGDSMGVEGGENRARSVSKLKESIEPPEIPGAGAKLALDREDASAELSDSQVFAANGLFARNERRSSRVPKSHAQAFVVPNGGI